jgi:hypothetical protein
MKISTIMTAACAAVLLTACAHPERENPDEETDATGCKTTSSLERTPTPGNSTAVGSEVTFVADLELAWGSGGGSGGGGGGKGGHGTNCP